MPCPFPQEILDAIVSELDDRSLGQCSLSSWSLLLPTRRSRFRCIVISQGDETLLAPGYKCKKFLNLVQILDNDPSRQPPRAREGYPTLSSCIRSLVLGITSDENPALDSLLPAVLERLTHVARVSLYSDGRACVWRFIDPSITSAIVHFLQSPAIKTLALIGIRGFPAVTIIHCPNLTELVLGDMDQDNSTVVIDTLTAPQSPNPRSLCEPPSLPPSLERLSSRASESFLVSVFNTPNVAVVFENLQELSLREVGIRDFNPALLAVNAVAKTLKVLRIANDDLVNHSDDGSPAIERWGDLSRLTRLTTLDIHFKHIIALSFTPLLPTKLITLLETTSAPTSVEVLNLKIAWEYYYPLSAFEDLIFSHRGWDDLDVLLSGPASKYPRLKDVSIWFEVDLDGIKEPELNPLEAEEAKERVLPKVRGLFPRLRGKEGIDVKVSIEVGVF